MLVLIIGFCELWLLLFVPNLVKTWRVGFLIKSLI
jgi:hypothetical protein